MNVSTTLIILYAYLYCRGTEMHCTDCLRVSVGTHPENVAFIDMLATVASDKGVI